MIFKKHIPNSITSCNLISGCVAIYFALSQDMRMAFFFIILGAVFDFFDGMSARLLHVSSPIGKELDSLADVVTFGVAPSAMVFSTLQVVLYPHWLQSWVSVLPFFAFIMAAFSALRLAKFNLDERQAMGFIGLPTPANALFWGALLVKSDDWLEAYPLFGLSLYGLVLLASFLLVAELPMFALKFKRWGWKGNEVRYGFLLSCLPLILIFGTVAFSFIVLWYVVLSAIVHYRHIEV